MKLINYIKLRGGSATLACPHIAELATAAKCSAASLYLIVKGHRKPSWKLTRRIVAATDGAVTESELRPDVFAQSTHRPGSEAA